MPTAINVGTPSKKRGGPVFIKWYSVTAAQTFKTGDWVYLTSGKLSIAATSGNDVGNISLLGRATAPASDVLGLSGQTTWNTNYPTPSAFLCPVEVQSDNVEWLFAVYHSTSATAVLAATDVGATWPLRNQGGQWVGNKENDGTNDRIIVTEIDSRYPIGEVYGLFWGKVLAANRQVG